MNTSNPPQALHLRPASAADWPQLLAWQHARPEREAAPLRDAADTQRWVAVDAQGDLIATLALQAHMGLKQPRAWYHVGLAVHAAAELQMYKQQRTLLLGNNLTGYAELCDILWRPPAGQHDEVLDRSARDRTARDRSALDQAAPEQAAPDQAAPDGATFDCAAPPPAALVAIALLVQQAQAAVQGDRQRWGLGLIMELPGEVDDAAQSPFWQGLTQHFYRGDRAQAQARCGQDWRQHLAALLPRQGVYASFLSDAAQAAIGQQHRAWTPVRQALQTLGCVWRGHITIDEGAAVLEWQPPPLP